MNQIVSQLTAGTPVMLSKPEVCPKCGTGVLMVGEQQPRGNWYCPADGCDYWTPLQEMRHFPSSLAVMVVRNEQVILPSNVTDEAIRGLAETEDLFLPRGIEVFPLKPSYGVRRKLEKRQLLAEAEDFSRTGRVKSAIRFRWSLVFNGFSLEEYETLLSFWDAHPYSVPFTYIDYHRDTSHLCYFDSEVDGEDVSFNDQNFTVQIVGS